MFVYAVGGFVSLVTLYLNRGRILCTADCGMPSYRAACLSDFFGLGADPSRTSLTLASVTWFTGDFIVIETSSSFEQLKPLVDEHFLWWFHNKLRTKSPLRYSQRIMFVIQGHATNFLLLACCLTTAVLTPLVVRLGNWKSTISVLDHVAYLNTLR
jgi:hypothetical protein